MKDYWVKNIRLKKGTLHKQLGIDKDKKLPVSLLKKILHSKAGKKISNNKKTIRITPLLKKRVNLALNLKKMKK